MFYTVLQILVPVFLIWHGYKLKYKTPPFNAERAGVSTWRTREGKEQWDIGNKGAGVYCMIIGALFCIAYIVKHIICGTETIMLFNYIYSGLCLAAVFSIVPVAHAVINKKLGVKGPKLKEEHAAPPKRSSKSAPKNALKPHNSKKKKTKKKKKK